MFLSYIGRTSLFLLLLQPKLAMCFSILGMLEKFFPSTHSPLLLLLVLLRQSSRPKYVGKYLNRAVRLIMILGIGTVRSNRYFMIGVLTILWSHSARPEPNNFAAWKAIASRRNVTVARVFEVVGRLLGLFIIKRINESDSIMHHTHTTDQCFVEAEEGDELTDLWIDMDNAPPLDPPHSRLRFVSIYAQICYWCQLRELESELEGLAD